MFPEEFLRLVHLPLYFKSERAQPAPSECLGHHWSLPGTPALTHPGQGTSHTSPCHWENALGQSQRHRDNRDRGFLEVRRNVMTQHNPSLSRGPGPRKHFPGCTQLVPTVTLGAAPPFPLVCRRGQLGLRAVDGHSHDSQLEGGRVPLSPQFRRGSAHLVKRRSSTCWGVPKAL